MAISHHVTNPILTKKIRIQNAFELLTLDKMKLNTIIKIYKKF